MSPFEGGSSRCFCRSNPNPWFVPMRVREWGRYRRRCARNERCSRRSERRCERVAGGGEDESALLAHARAHDFVVPFDEDTPLELIQAVTPQVLCKGEDWRDKGVVGKFVEFYGDGLAEMPLADRATLGNMSPEFGSTCAIFPIDGQTTRYLELSGRDPKQIALVEAYATVPAHDVDPTLFAALAYMVMFGMMFADVGHGALLVLALLAVYLIGSTTERVMRKARCDVLAVKPEGFVTPVKL